MKKQVDTVDATPSKRLYLSIIADYDLNKGICELIDNALDIWIKNNKSNKLEISIVLDETQQTIVVKDNAGGVSKEELSNIVGPGHSSNSEKDETIGIFGVGTKRAVIALAQEIKIKTRKKDNPTYQVEFDDNWILNNEDWHLAVYEISNIETNSTFIEMTKLRIRIDAEKIEGLKQHLSATYSKFLSHKNLNIKLNNIDITPISYEKWAFPPNFEPRNFSGEIITSSGESVKVEAIAGLSTESSPSGGEWGVYIYCNNRLIAPGLKTFEVGFAPGMAGKPHPSISLVRVLLFITGPAKLMPWNSSKSDINTSNEIFITVRKWLINIVSDYASLSRRFNQMEGGWPENVFKYDVGKIIKEKNLDFETANTSYLPPLPEVKIRYAQKIQNANKEIGKDKPWTRGLYESIVAVDLISKQNLEQKNRICLLLLDSTLEIGFKEYLVYESGVSYGDDSLQKMFKDRNKVHEQVKQDTYRLISASDWQSIDFYYKVRCDLIHRKASATITDTDLDNYREVVERVLEKLFNLKFSFE